MDAAERTAIFEHLRIVLASKPFRGNRRARAYLHYVVTETVDGRAESLTKTGIGMAVWGRDDESTRARIRDKADDVEARLRAFYRSRAGRDSNIWFALDWTSLAPVIGPILPPRPPWPGIYFPPELEPKPKVWTPVLPGLGMVVTIIAISLFSTDDRKPKVNPSIWNPFLNSERMALLCEPFPNELMKVAPMFPNRDTRAGSLITRTDIRLHPTVLFSGCTTPWSSALAKTLRFQSGAPGLVTDTHTGSTLQGVLVSRVIDSGNGQPLLSIEGWTLDNRSVVDLLNSDTELTKALGSGWLAKSFQLVVQCDGELPARIIASNNW